MKGKYARLFETCDVGDFVQQDEAKMAPDSLPLCEAGQCLADLATIQAIFRDLDGGETRKDLVRMVNAGFARRKWHSTSGVQKHVDTCLGPVKAE